VLALVLARAVNQLGAFAMSFLAVTLVDVYGASLVTAGWVVSLFGLATVPSRLAGGRMADRLGRRPTIVVGLLGCAAALLVIAASPGVSGAAVGAALGASPKRSGPLPGLACCPSGARWSGSLAPPCASC
jgi:predicted MFS family arabinose efflux permease